jgi:hypothetical protein
MLMKTILNFYKQLLLFSIIATIAFQQPIFAQYTQSDCCGAIPLEGMWMNSGDSYYEPFFSGPGFNKEGFLFCPGQCNPGPEIHSRWYKFQCVAPGSFEFVAIHIPLNLDPVPDINWTLYAEECPCGLNTQEIACNSFAPHGPANSGGSWTGITSDIGSSFPFLPPYTPPPPTDPPSLGPFNQTVFLEEGLTYYLYINNTSQDLILAMDLYFAGTAGIAPPDDKPGPLEPGPSISGNFAPCPNGATENYLAFSPNFILGQTFNWTLLPTGPPIGNEVAEIGVVWDQPGTYKLCVEIVEGCFPVSQQTCETIVVGEIPPSFEEDEACLGDPYIAGNGQAFFAPGTFTVNYVTEKGCDSTVFLTLDVLFPSDTFLMAEICEGDSYEVNGINYEESGFFQDFLINDVGCDSIVNFLLVVLPFEIEVLPERDTINCKKSLATLDASTSIVDEDAIFTWRDENGFIVWTGPVFEPNFSGTFTLEVEASYGCIGEKELIVDEDFTTPFADAGPEKEIDCKEAMIELDGFNSTQSTAVEYEWIGPGIISGGNTLNPMVNVAGIYNLIITNVNSGCTDEAFVEVFENKEPPFADAGNDGQLTCSITSVTLDGSGSSQNGFFTYEWTGPGILSGGNSLTPTVNIAGAYTLIVTDENNGCTSEAEAFVLIDDTLPEVSAGDIQQIDCNNETAILVGSSSESGTYSWSGPLILSGENTLTPEVGAPGDYILTVITAAGCSNLAQTTVELDLTPPIADPGQSMALNCNAEQLILNGDGSSQGVNFTYNWIGPSITNGINTLNPTINEPGIYELTVTNMENGCIETANVEIIETPPPTLVLDSQTNVDCAGNSTGSATVIGADGALPYSYKWSSGGDQATEENLETGVYTVTLTDNDGCTTTESITIEEPPLLVATSSSTNLTKVGSNDGIGTCNPDGGTMPYSYEWSNGNTTQSIENLAPGMYEVTITDANGCQVIESITVEDFDCSPVGLTLDTENVACKGEATGSITANISNGASPVMYEWSNGNTTQIATDLIAGNYIVTITDDNGCVLIQEIAIEEPPSSLEVSVVGTDESGWQLNDGTATATPTGGSGDFTYLWDNGATTQSIEGLPPGTYCVTITDANNCETSNCYEVALFPCNFITASFNTIDISCNEGSDGAATISLSGGTAPFTYEWSNGDTDETATNLSATTYQVTATDVNGCALIESVTLTQPDPIEISVLSITNADCEGSETGGAVVEASGGNAGFSYEWNNGILEPSIENVLSGTYTVTVTDDKDCVNALSIDIIANEDNEPPTVLTQDITVTLDANGVASITPNMINNSSSDNCELGNLTLDIFEFDCSHVGEVTVTLTANDVSGNSASEVAIVTVLDENAPTVNCPDDVFSNFCLFPVNYAIPTAEDACGIGAITLIEGLEPGSIFPLGSTEVVYLAVDNNGNETTCSFTVTVLNDLFAETEVVSPNCFGDANGEATVNVTGGTQPFTYVWDDPNTQFTQTATNLNSGFYSVVITDGTGCEIAATVEVFEPDSLFIETTTTGPCFGEPAGSATAIPNGGTAPFQYQWDDPSMQTLETAVNLPANTYNVIVTDSNNCEATGSVIVAELPAVEITVDEIVGELGSNMDGLISITPSGGTGSGYTFEWTYDGNFFSNEEDLSGLSAGEYCVTITDDDGCATTDCYSVDIIDNVNNYELDNYITITPNPTSDFLNVNMRLPLQSEVKIDFYDYLGRLILEGDNKVVLEEHFQFDLSDLPSGVYLIKLKVEEDILVKRIVVE